MAGISVPLAACGGGGGGSGSQSAFASKANAACGAVVDAQFANEPGNTAASAAAYAGSVASAYQHELKILTSLNPPASVQSDYQAFVGLNRELLADAQKAQKSAQKSDISGYTAAATQVVANEVQSLPHAAAAGLSTCAQKLPGSDESTLKSLLVRLSTHPTASDCTSSFTQHMIASNFHASVSDCQQNWPKSGASSASVLVLWGVGAHAKAILSQSGSPSSVYLTLIKADGTWKVDGATAPSPYVPPSTGGGTGTTP